MYHLKEKIRKSAVKKVANTAVHAEGRSVRAPRFHPNTGKSPRLYLVGTLSVLMLCSLAFGTFASRSFASPDIQCSTTVTFDNIYAGHDAGQWIKDITNGLGPYSNGKTHTYTYNCQLNPTPTMEAPAGNGNGLNFYQFVCSGGGSCGTGSSCGGGSYDCTTMTISGTSDTITAEYGCSPGVIC